MPTNDHHVFQTLHGQRTATPRRANLLPLLAALLASIGGSLMTIVRRYRNMRDYDHLLGQPDHMLRDIGLTHDDVVAARRCVWSDAHDGSRGRYHRRRA